MVNVCLIGCGGVGKRHLEAMLKVKHDINIEVVEPNIEDTLVNQNINYFTKIEEVSDNIKDFRDEYRISLPVRLHDFVDIKRRFEGCCKI